MNPPRTTLPASLRADWWRGLLATSLLPAVVAAAAATGAVSFSWRWWLAAWLGIAYVSWRVWQWLPWNHPPAGGAVYPRLGRGNAVSWMRGALLALVAAAVLTHEGMTRPGLGVTAAVYALAAMLDFVDGWLARHDGQVTRLGQRLDLHLDGWGVFWAAAAAVQSGQMPPWFCAVGLARPAYVLYEAALTARGYRPGPWPRSRWRRWLAGAMMVFLAGVLMPWFAPPLTTWIGAVLTVPFLAHFVLDAVVITRRAQPRVPA